MSPADLSAIATVIQAIGTYAWPVVVLVVAKMYQNDISKFIGRIESGKFEALGGKFEAKLDALQIAVEKTGETAIALPAPISQAGLPAAPTLLALPEPSVPKPDQTTDATELILSEAARSPTLGLILLASEIDKETNRLIDIFGIQRRGSTARQNVRTLVEKGLLSPLYVEAIDRFSVLQNEIVQGGARVQVSDAEIIRAIDSGLRLLQQLNDIPLNISVVVHPKVKIYSDAECRVLRDDVHGVVVTTPANPDTKRVQATRSDHFIRGQRLSWEWSLANKWGESWYRDPDTDAIEYAWTESGEYTGRNLAASAP